MKPWLERLVPKVQMIVIAVIVVLLLDPLDEKIPQPWHMVYRASWIAIALARPVGSRVSQRATQLPHLRPHTHGRRPTAATPRC